MKIVNLFYHFYHHQKPKSIFLKLSDVTNRRSGCLRVKDKIYLIKQLFRTFILIISLFVTDQSNTFVTHNISVSRQVSETNRPLVKQKDAHWARLMSCMKLVLIHKIVVTLAWKRILSPFLKSLNVKLMIY